MLLLFVPAAAAAADRPPRGRCQNNWSLARRSKSKPPAASIGVRAQTSAVSNSSSKERSSVHNQ